jgi:hypothetical protein
MIHAVQQRLTWATFITHAVSAGLHAWRGALTSPAHSLYHSTAGFQDPVYALPSSDLNHSLLAVTDVTALPSTHRSLQLITKCVAATTLHYCNVITVLYYHYFYQPYVQQHYISLLSEGFHETTSFQRSSSCY